MTARRNLIWGVGALAVCACAVGLTVARRGSLARFAFLRDAEFVSRERIAASKATKDVIRLETFNVHLPYQKVASLIDRELASQGFRRNPSTVDWLITWMKKGVGYGSGLKLVCATDGRARTIAGLDRSLAVAPDVTSAGWTIVEITEQYEPGWLELAWDRLGGPPAAYPGSRAPTTTQTIPGESYRAYLDGAKKR